LEPHEVANRAAAEDVVPAAGVQRFDIHPVIEVRDLDFAPVVIVGLVLDPIAEVRRDLGCRRHIEEPIVFGGQLFDPLPRTIQRGRLPAHGVFCQPRRPRTGEPLHQRATFVGPTLVIFHPGDVGKDSDQMWGIRRGGEHLCCADIGAAEHTNAAIRVGQAGRPFNRVVAVIRLVPEWIKLAFGIKTSPGVLQDDDIAVRSEIHPRRRVFAINGEEVLFMSFASSVWYSSVVIRHTTACFARS
jgi:hypothetical protein